MGRLIISFFLFLFLIAILYIRLTFHSPVDYGDQWMDSPLTKDVALTDPSLLASNRYSEPTKAQKQQPVFVLVHGFSASTFEFEAFKSVMSKKDTDVLFSSVLLGGHGRDFDAFKSATYEDWFLPVYQEVSRLNALGFENIVLFGASTGGAGVLHLLLNGDFDQMPIQHIFLIDPYIKPKNRMLYLAPWLKFIVRNTRSSSSELIEYQNWYTNRPAESLTQLIRFVKKVRSQLALAKRTNLPSITIFTAEFDPTSATEGANIVQSSLGDSIVDVLRYPSNRHVIIESQTKKNWSELDQANFDFIIQTIYSKIQIIKN